MPQSLLIVVRFSEGRYHGQDDGFNGADGWPPSPGRLFQALVAAAARGANLLPEDVRALEWMEGLKPPRIAAPAARRGSSTSPWFGSCSAAPAAATRLACASRGAVPVAASRSE